MSPDEIAEIEAEARELNVEYTTLQALRKSLNMTQEELAEIMEVAQHTVSRMERQDDMSISTLQRIVQAMGGELRLLADFPDRQVVIDQFVDE